MSIRESNSRTFLREAGLGDWFGVSPAVVEFRRFPGEHAARLCACNRASRSQDFVG